MSVTLLLMQLPNRPVLGIGAGCLMAREEPRFKAICETRVRYGYRRVHVMLQREGWAISIKRTHRIYNELGLQLRNKTPKQRVKAKLREDRVPATRPNDIGPWTSCTTSWRPARRSGS